MKFQNKNRRLVIVEVGNVPGGGSPPQGSFTQHVAAIPQAIYQNVAQGLNQPGFGPAVVGYAGKKFSMRFFQIKWLKALKLLLGD